MKRSARQRVVSTKARGGGAPPFTPPLLVPPAKRRIVSTTPSLCLTALAQRKHVATCPHVITVAATENDATVSAHSSSSCGSSAHSPHSVHTPPLPSPDSSVCEREPPPQHVAPSPTVASIHTWADLHARLGRAREADTGGAVTHAVLPPLPPPPPPFIKRTSSSYTNVLGDARACHFSFTNVPSTQDEAAARDDTLLLTPIPTPPSCLPPLHEQEPPEQLRLTCPRVIPTHALATSLQIVACPPTQEQADATQATTMLLLHPASPVSTSCVDAWFEADHDDAVVDTVPTTIHAQPILQQQQQQQQQCFNLPPPSVPPHIDDLEALTWRLPPTPPCTTKSASARDTGGDGVHATHAPSSHWAELLALPPHILVRRPTVTRFDTPAPTRVPRVIDPVTTVYDPRAERLADEPLCLSTHEPASTPAAAPPPRPSPPALVSRSSGARTCVLTPRTSPHVYTPPLVRALVAAYVRCTAQACALRVCTHAGVTRASPSMLLSAKAAYHETCDVLEACGRGETSRAGWCSNSSSSSVHDDDVTDAVAHYTIDTTPSKDIRTACLPQRPISAQLFAMDACVAATAAALGPAATRTIDACVHTLTTVYTHSAWWIEDPAPASAPASASASAPASAPPRPLLLIPLSALAFENTSSRLRPRFLTNDAPVITYADTKDAALHAARRAASSAVAGIMRDARSAAAYCGSSSSSSSSKNINHIAALQCAALSDGGWLNPPMREHLATAHVRTMHTLRVASVSTPWWTERGSSRTQASNVQDGVVRALPTGALALLRAVRWWGTLHDPRVCEAQSLPPPPPPSSQPQDDAQHASGGTLPPPPAAALSHSRLCFVYDNVAPRVVGQPARWVPRYAHVIDVDEEDLGVTLDPFPHGRDALPPAAAVVFARALIVRAPALPWSKVPAPSDWLADALTQHIPKAHAVHDAEGAHALFIAAREVLDMN